MSAPERPPGGWAERMDAYCHGLLSEAEAAEIERWVAQSPEAAAALAEAQQRKAELEATRPQRDPREPQIIARTQRELRQQALSRRRRVRRFATLGVLAAALLLVGVSVWYWQLPEPQLQLRVQLPEELTATQQASIVVTLQNAEGQFRRGTLTVQLFDTQGNPVAEPWTLADVEGEVSTQWPIPDVPAGTYRLHIAADSGFGSETVTQIVPVRRPHRVDVLSLAQQVRPGTEAAVRVLVRDSVTHAVRPEVPVEVLLVDASGTRQSLPGRARTDATGSCEVRYRVPADWPNGSYQMQLKVQGEQSVDVFHRPILLRRDTKVMVSTDKPVYQPGQTIHMRTLALRRPDLKPAAQFDAVLRVFDPRGNVIFKRQGQCSDFGIFAADCPLADEVLEGTYRVQAQIGDSESFLTIEVKRYVLPKFRIEVHLDRPWYQPGQAVAGTVKARYFHGEPVRNAQVRFELENVHQPLEPRTTDDRGESRFVFQLPASMVGLPQDDGKASFAVTVEVTDTAGQVQALRVRRVVANEPFTVEVLPENGTLVPGVANRVYLLASAPDGTPVAARVEETVSGQALTLDERGFGVLELTPTAARTSLRLRAQDPLGRVVRTERVYLQASNPRDFLVRVDKAVLDGGDELRVDFFAGRSVEPIFVDFLKDGQTVRSELVPLRDGKGTLRFAVPADWLGGLQMNAYRWGNEGLPVRKSRAFFVRASRQLRIEARLDAVEYRPGGQAKLQVQVVDERGQPTPSALSLAAIDEAVFAVLEQRPGVERQFFLLQEELLQPIYAIYPWTPEEPAGPNGPPIEDPQRIENRQRFDAALFARTVRSEERLPGMPQLGAPAGMVYREWDLEQTVKQLRQWHWRIGTAVVVGWLLVVLAGGAIVASIAWERYRNYLRDGYERLARGETVRFLWTPKRLLSLAIAGSGVLLLLVYVAGEQISREFGIVMAPEAAMLAGLDQRADARLGMDIKKSDELTDREASSSAIRVRRNFPETLLWLPERITDDQGRATIDIDLADSITTWRLSGSAVSADGRLGAWQQGLRVFQPFFVDFQLPVALTRGDEVTVPVVVSNYLNEPQIVEVHLADLDWAQRLGTPATQTLRMKANEVRAVEYRLHVSHAGRQRLNVVAKSERFGDAVERSIDVRPEGHKVEVVTNGRLSPSAQISLSIPRDAVEGSAQMFVKLYPSSFSQVLEGMENIFQLPYGCFEQTSSTTYPNVLALSYLQTQPNPSLEVLAKARQYIHLGYQRLLSFEIADGGFDWFGRPPGKVTLTAYGLMQFEDMAKVYDVDPKLLQRTRDWLLQQRKADGSWPIDRDLAHELSHGTSSADLERLRKTAYVAWAVFSGGKSETLRGPTLHLLQSYDPKTIDEPYLIALTLNALAVLQADASLLAAWRARLGELQQSDGPHRYWQAKAGSRTAFYGTGQPANIETTALAVLALLAVEPGDALSDEVRAALAWLVKHRDSRGTWWTTQATVLTLRAILQSLTRTAHRPHDRRIEIALDGQVIRQVNIPKDQAEVLQQIDLSQHVVPGAERRLTVRDLTNAETGFQVLTRWHVRTQPPPTGESPLEVVLNYDKTEVNLAEQLTASVVVRNRTPEPMPMVLLDLPVPPGFAPNLDDFEQLVRDGKIEKYQVQPTRVLVYLRSLSAMRPLAWMYRLQAKQVVRVQAPSAIVYEYYNPAQRAMSAAGPTFVVHPRP